MQANIIAAEYLQKISSDPRCLIHNAKLIYTLPSHSSPVHGGWREKNALCFLLHRLLSFELLLCDSHFETWA